MTEDYLARADFDAIILGDSDVPSKIDQDAADKLVEGYLMHLLRQVDFPSRMARINVEALRALWSRRPRPTPGRRALPANVPGPMARVWHDYSGSGSR